MVARKKATEATPKTEDKDRSKNHITGGNDARKEISDLRRSGWDITDLKLSSGCKLYWLISKSQKNNE